METAFASRSPGDEYNASLTAWVLQARGERNERGASTRCAGSRNDMVADRTPSRNHDFDPVPDPPAPWARRVEREIRDFTLSPALPNYRGRGLGGRYGKA